MTTKTISAECQEWIDRQSGEFMKPYSRLFKRNEQEDDDSEFLEPGWYSRLSAPGYLDCTEWTGPFDTEEEAMMALFEMFGDD